MADSAKVLAELAAMRARGEITAEQYDEAKRLAQEGGEPDDAGRLDFAADRGRQQSPQETVRRSEPISRPQPARQPEPATKPERKKTTLGEAIQAFMLFGVIIFVVVKCTGLGPESEKDAARRVAMEKAEERKKESDKKKGFHCLSAWDGSYRALNEAVTATLRDPDSFEASETRIGPVSGVGTHNVILTFRAKNGFGGTNVGTAKAIIKNSDCSMVDWQMLDAG